MLLNIINDLFEFSVVSTIFVPKIRISETFLTVEGKNLHMAYFQLVLTNSSSQVHAFIIIFRHKIFNFFINLSRFIEKLFQVVLAMFEFFHHERHVAL
jgi:hypothetical protein